jgi:RNA polymerase sigma-70 factor (ECF subfamily)
VSPDDDIAALVVCAQRGDALACEKLARRFLRAAYSVALAVLVRRADAEDVAQEAMITALERIGTCREPKAFQGWLLQIVRNRAKNQLDKRRLRDVTRDGEERELGVDDAPAELVDRRRRLLRGLASISATQREVVLLHDLEEWTHGEIASNLGISEGMSRQHLFQARRALRESLVADAPEAESGEGA